MLGNPSVFFDVPTQPDGNMRSERPDRISCDGSVRLAIEVCDGSLKDIESIAFDLPAFRNPGTNLAMQVVGRSQHFAMGLEGPFVITNEGQCEIERLRVNPGFGAGAVRHQPCDPPRRREPSAGRFRRQRRDGGQHRAVRGADDRGRPVALARLLCAAGASEIVDTVIALAIDNPGDADRLLRVAAQMRWAPGRLIPIPLHGRQLAADRLARRFRPSAPPPPRLIRPAEHGTPSPRDRRPPRRSFPFLRDSPGPVLLLDTPPPSV